MAEGTLVYLFGQAFGLFLLIFIPIYLLKKRKQRKLERQQKDEGKFDI